MKKTLAALALSVAFVAPSHADVVYNSATSFQAQVATGALMESFTNVSGPANAVFTNGSFAFVLSSTSGLYTNGDFVGANASGENLLITFTGSAVTAIGGNFFATDVFDDFADTAITVTLSNGTSSVLTPTSAANSYLGFTTDLAITSVTISGASADTYVGLDNLTVGVAVVAAPDPGPSPVPEPGSLALLGLGLVGVVTARRRSM